MLTRCPINFDERGVSLFFFSFSGKDGSDAFSSVGHSPDAIELRDAKYLIGTLKPSQPQRWVECCNVLIVHQVLNWPGHTHFPIDHDTIPSEWDLYRGSV